ncbi:MAG: hypothetical protein JNL42_17260 [Anaerolineae bacterium]|nr:hypothetical protein [Anaerolineae bacterium]
MDLSGGLYTLPSEALTILRFFANAEGEAAHVDAIIDATGLSDRGFGKGIRRLVTRNYLTLSGEQVYRLTEQGRRAVRALGESGDLDSMMDEMDESDLGMMGDEPRFVRRRLILVAPDVLPAEQTVRVIVGFDEPEDDDRLENAPNILLRLGVLNGEPSRSQEVSLALGNDHLQHTFQVTPNATTRARLRAEVFQFKETDDDFEFCGGMYLDLPVERRPDETALKASAYGVDVILREPSAS